MGHEFGKRFPANPKDYQLHEEVGEGVSATVYRASCIPMNEIVAIKVLDLEKCNNDLDGIRREVQTMRLIDHPNLVQAYCSFPAGHKLWVVMPYMAGGSCLHIMKFAHPEGFEEPVIATLLFEVLKALVYLHGEGHIHRDVKAGNILIDANGAVKLADFGVAACMFDTGDRQRSRNTFVGTPCWMAPEVMQQLHGYDFKADIWSFGITALELAHGHAPFSKYPPMKVLLMTLQNAPPGLDYERDRKFSKSFKEMISACLVKDPKKRPSSEKLLKHHFFKHARSREYLARAVLDGLPPLGDRFRTIKGRESDLLQSRADEDKDQLSQREYIKGISAWNFNLEDLKKQAALIEEENQGSENFKVNDGTHREHHGAVSLNFQQQISPSEKVDTVDSATSGKEELQYHQDFGGLLASTFPIRPLKALEGYFDVYEDVKETSPNSQFAKKSEIESITSTQQASDEVDLEFNKGKEDYLESSSFVTKNVDAPGRQKYFSGSILSEHALSPVRILTGPKEWNELFKEHQFERNHSGPLLCRQTRDAQNHLPVNALDEPSEGRIVQRKGRFKVTSTDAGSKVATSVNPANVITARASLDATSVLSILQHMLQQNATQREQIIKAIKLVEQVSAPHVERADYGSAESLQSCVAASRERELQAYVLQLQQRADYISDELQRMKLKNAQFERHLTCLLKGRTANNDEIQEAFPPH